MSERRIWGVLKLAGVIGYQDYKEKEREHMGVGAWRNILFVGGCHVWIF